MTAHKDDIAECICGEINARHCPVHNERMSGEEFDAYMAAGHLGLWNWEPPS